MHNIQKEKAAERVVKEIVSGLIKPDNEFRNIVARALGIKRKTKRPFGGFDFYKLNKKGINIENEQEVREGILSGEIVLYEMKSTKCKDKRRSIKIKFSSSELELANKIGYLFKLIIIDLNYNKIIYDTVKGAIDRAKNIQKEISFTYIGE